VALAVAMYIAHYDCISKASKCEKIRNETRKLETKDNDKNASKCEKITNETRKFRDQI
jgi:hypothetical protein